MTQVATVYLLTVLSVLCPWSFTQNNVTIRSCLLSCLSSLLKTRLHYYVSLFMSEEMPHTQML